MYQFFHTAELIIHLISLGLAINWKNSGPLLHQRVEYLGVELYAYRLQATLSEHRQTALQQAVCKLCWGAIVRVVTGM